MILPCKALSVCQPWAWAIIHAGKDVENRTAVALRHMNLDGVDRLAIHASKGMTRDEYDGAAEFMASIGVACPPARELLRGGIVGTVKFDGIARNAVSRWFFGPCAIVMRDSQPCDFIPARGALGLFDWAPAPADYVPPPAKWMLAETHPTAKAAPEAELPMFDEVSRA
jgi:hypothetical protein